VVFQRFSKILKVSVLSVFRATKSSALIQFNGVFQEYRPDLPEKQQVAIF